MACKRNTMPAVAIAWWLWLAFIASADIAGQSDDFYGTINVISTNSVTSLPYPMDNGLRTTTPLGDDFPTNCATCDKGAVTEHCYYEDGFCIKLSDTAVSIVGTNVSLLHGSPFPLDSSCTPRYLQRLKLMDFAVNCRDSYYHLITNFVVDEISQGPGAREGILIQAPSHLGHHRLYHVEIDSNEVISFDVLGGSGVQQIYLNDDCTHPLSLYPIFSREGKFVLLCHTNTEEKVYFLHTLNTASDPVPITLCDAPLSSPNGHTFSVACNGTLTIFKSNNVEHFRSRDFSSNITLHTYLNPATVLIILNAGNQRIVQVDRFLNGNGTEGVLILHNTSKHSLTHKLITPSVYATTSRSDVQLFNTSNGQALMPVSNLQEPPVDVYFEVGRTPSSTVTSPLIEPTNISSPTTISVTATHSLSVLPSNMPETESPKHNKTSPITPTIITLIVVSVVLLVVLSTLCGLLVICIRKFKSCQQNKKKLIPSKKKLIPSIIVSQVQSSLGSQYPYMCASSHSGTTTPNSNVTSSSAIPSVEGSLDELRMLSSPSDSQSPLPQISQDEV